MLNLIPICYATSTVDIINAVHDNFAGDINNTIDFWYWLAGIFLALIALSLLFGGLFFFFKTIFK